MDELLTKYYSSHKKKKEMEGESSMDGRDEYRVLMGKPKGRKQHGRPRSRWGDSIKADLQ